MYEVLYMMQFTKSSATSYPPPALGCLNLDRPAKLIQPNTKSRVTMATTTSSSSFSSASCMEQLLVHCAHAVDRNDYNLAHQILWVLNTIAPPDGDSTQRLTSAFLRSLILRASLTGMFPPPINSPPSSLHRFSPLDLATFIDLTPLHRFGYSASNAAILEAVEGFPLVHIVDLSTTHCMQIPTLIDALANRPEGPPFLRLTVPNPGHDSSRMPSCLIPPVLDFSYDELGSKLVNFARTRNVGMEFRAVHANPSDGFQTLISELRLQRLEGEALVVNCQMLLHYLPDEETLPQLVPSIRTMFLKNIRSLEPNLVTLVDEDADFTGSDVVGRLSLAFNYLWIPFDAVDTFLPKGSEKREWYEAEISWKIENVIAREGMGRVERPETRGRWAGRMRGVGFQAVGAGEEAVAEVKGMLDEHSAGWGLKKEEDLDLVLTWKGHNVVFASAWVPT